MTTHPPYYCITHQPCAWPLPDFMTVIGTGSYVPERGIALSRDFPDLAHRNASLGEYVALFAIRRLLQASGASGFVGLCHYRRYVLPTPLGEVRGIASYAPATQLADLTPADFYGDGQTPIVSASFDFRRSVLQQYANDGVGRDLLMYFGDAIDCGVISNQEAAQFLSGSVFAPAPTVAYIPVQWFIDIVQALEVVTSRFHRYHHVEREGYQSRAIGFSCERLHALLLSRRIAEWGADRVMTRVQTILSADGASKP